MQPYSTPFYFVLLVSALVPVIISHLFGKKLLWYQYLLTFVFLWITFSATNTIWAVIGFGIFQTLLIKAYEWYRVKKQKNQTAVFYSAVLLSIVPLFIVKLSPYLSGPGRPLYIIGFLGISYVTFKTVSMIIEIRDGLIKEVPLKDFLYFLYFYPTISSGPIDRFRRFSKELNSPVKDNYGDLLNKGVFRIFQGFLYKFIIGYLLDQYWLHGIAIAAVIHPNFWTITQAMYAYGLYLFFDFAGYSLFALGISNLMGYDLPQNFNKPFLAKNIHDFWNRWHMTLSFWFRDFVFMRLVKTFMVKKWSKNMVTISNVGYLANMLLMGLWHGLTWYYVLYGLYHAVLMIVYDAWLRLKKKRKWKIPNNKWTAALSIFITFNLVFIGFLIFSGIPNYILMRLHEPMAHHQLPNF
ncbi:D-alanyl-lipoteichoic acid biosynthesis protein DltB [Lactovum odontotermitis]